MLSSYQLHQSMINDQQSTIGDTYSLPAARQQLTLALRLPLIFPLPRELEVGEVRELDGLPLQELAVALGDVSWSGGRAARCANRAQTSAVRCSLLPGYCGCQECGMLMCATRKNSLQLTQQQAAHRSLHDATHTSRTCQAQVSCCRSADVCTMHIPCDCESTQVGARG